MSAQQQLITVDDISEENAPAIYVLGGLKPFLEHTRSQVCGEVPDLTTRKGRECIASLAAEVSRSKKAVENPGRDYLRRLKEMPKVVEAELREFVTKMDALRDATRQPLTEWEEAEQARKDKHVDGIQAMRDFLIFEGAPSADQVGHIISILDLVSISDTWEEFLPEAAQVKEQTLAKLRALLAERTQYEAEQAELARLRIEAEAREKADREAAIAQAAADKAKREAAEAAQAERDAAARREQALIDQAAQAKRDADQKARDAEAAAANQALQLKLAAEQAERQKLQAEADRVAAAERAKQQAIEADQRQAAAVERAKQAEIDRANAAADEINRQAAAREADKAHKGAIYKAAKEAFIANGMSEECARLAVKVIASNLIPNISIKY